MNLRTIGTTLTAAAALALSLSACGSAQQTPPAPQLGSAQGGTYGGSNTQGGESPDEQGPCEIGNMEPSFELSSTGHVNAHLKVTNAGEASCTLTDDFPDITFMDREGNPSDGLQINHGQPGTGGPVILEPGQSAAADVEWPADQGGPDGPACNRVWAVSLKMNNGEPKTIEPTNSGVFDLCGGEATISSWQED
ncbi:DUF4232 domain-containing protein [Saccharopolyspora shandongensis]|uniref:DUF4232 domain-containing protein n=1 Tax=Saccharopolyspora shandongensis TaxID=418495 RepID=UPI003420FC8B